MIVAYSSFDGVISIVFGCACVAIVFFRTTVSGRMYFIDWSVLFIGLIYGFSAPIVMHALQENPNQYAGSEFVLAHEGDYAIHTIVVTVAVLGLFSGWGIATRASRGTKTRRPLFRGLDEPGRFIWVFWMMLVVAVVAQFLYSMDYGGLAGVTDYARLIRSGLIADAERSQFSFLRPIAGFSILATYGFLGLLLSKTRGHRFGLSIGFLASCAFALYVLDTWQGRLGVAVFIATLALTLILSRGTKPITLILGFMGAALLGMYGVYLVSEIWELKTADSFAHFYAKEISFIFTGFWAEWAAAESTTRLFYDLLVMPLFLLPSSWTTGWFENVQAVHTATIWGAAKGQNGVTSGMPLDFVTVGFLQLNVIGVFVFALLFGMVLRGLQTMVDYIEVPGVRAAALAYIALRIAGLGLFYAHPEQLVASNLPLIITLFLLWVFRGRRLEPKPGTISIARAEPA